MLSLIHEHVLISKYIAIGSDPSYHVLGFPPCPGLFSPIEDPSIPPSEGLAMFPEWVSGFYSHALSPSFPASSIENSKSALKVNSLADPPPTVCTLSHQDIDATVCAGPAVPAGSDGILFEAGQRLGLFEEMRKRAFSMGVGSTGIDARQKVKKWWKNVEIRVIWCDRSPYSMPWGIRALYNYLEDAKTTGRARDGEVNIVRMKGANHFVSSLISHENLCAEFMVRTAALGESWAYITCAIS